MLRRHYRDQILLGLIIVVVIALIKVILWVFEKL